jgi:DNA-binding NarL/FixJ family response regulator
VTDERARLFVIDDHSLVRLGMRQLLDGEPDMHVVGEAADLAGALAQLTTMPVDLVLLDLSLGSGDGLDALKQLRAQQTSRAGPEVTDRKVLVITTHDERVYGERVIRGGAVGYVMKATPAEEVLAAIRKALRGELAISQALAGTLLNSVVLGQKSGNQSPLASLSDRELEIFKLVGKGLSTRDIASSLGISAKTVETHQFNLRTKLGMASTHQLRHMAFTWVNTGSFEEP